MHTDAPSVSEPPSPSKLLLQKADHALKSAFDADLENWWRAKLLMVPVISVLIVECTAILSTSATAHEARARLIETANFELVLLPFLPGLFTLQFVAAMMRSASVAAVFPGTREWTVSENDAALRRIGTGTGKLHACLNWLACAVLWGAYWIPGFTFLPMNHPATWPDLVLWSLLLLIGPILCSKVMANLRVGLLRRERSNTWPYVRKLLGYVMLCAVLQLSVSAYMLNYAISTPMISIRPFQSSNTANCASVTITYVKQYCNASIQSHLSEKHFGSVVYECDDGGFGGFSSLMTFCKASLTWDSLRSKGYATAAASLYAFCFLMFREGVASVSLTMTFEDSMLALLDGQISVRISIAIVCASVGAALMPVIRARLTRSRTAARTRSESHTPERVILPCSNHTLPQS
jgi:hypothetical protein